MTIKIYWVPVTGKANFAAGLDLPRRYKNNACVPTGSLPNLLEKLVDMYRTLLEYVNEVVAKLLLLLLLLLLLMMMMMLMMMIMMIMMTMMTDGVDGDSDYDIWQKV